MGIFLEILRNTVMGLVPLAAIFAVLALATKQRAALAGWAEARREIGTNLGLLLFNKLIWVPLVAIPIFAFHDNLPQLGLFAGFWAGLPAALVVVLALVLIDLAAYWRHRLEHTRELWRIHATHHADEAMSWLTLNRKHPLGEALSLLCDLVPVLLLGVPMWAIAAAALLRSWWGYFIHADVPWTLGPIGRVLMSPAAHRLHHIRDEALMGSNYGNTITLWDRLFGTYIDPAPYKNCETGIAEGTRDVMGELLRPFEARYRRAAPVPAPAPDEAAV